jgi:GNAT superfamily N-acetyltransferase
MPPADSVELSLDITTKPYAPTVGQFYDEYVRVFVLPDERESLSGFRDCLRLNGPDGETIHARFGPSREYVGLLRGPGNEIAAGLNFICFPMPRLGNVMTCHSNYVFILPAWRGRGLLRRIYQIMENVCREYAAVCGLAGNVTLISFGEQNDPFRMTLEAFERDSEATSINQFDRIAVWRRLGARVLAFPYVQPALSLDGDPDTTLFLRILLSNEARQAKCTRVLPVDPRIIHEHLLRFFAITVLKGRVAPEDVAVITEQLVSLRKYMETDRAVDAVQLPDEPIISAWKRRTGRLAADVHDRTVPIGRLIGIPSLIGALDIS